MSNILSKFQKIQRSKELDDGIFHRSRGSNVTPKRKGTPSGHPRGFHPKKEKVKRISQEQQKEIININHCLYCGAVPPKRCLETCPLITKVDDYLWFDKDDKIREVMKNDWGWYP